MSESTIVDFGGGDEIRFERTGVAGIITLTRPKALNALNLPMVRAMTAALGAWQDDAGVELVIIKGEGRAFCAGGDLMAVYNGKANPDASFFAEEYRLNLQIERYPKPYVAVIDGIVMGGGVGISCHGSHRVMTENALFAMPEVGIGFFPDVGGSHLLPDLADNFGMYLALTGARIKWGDAMWSGLATHPAKAADLPALVDMLARDGNVEQTLRNFFTMPKPETDLADWARIDGWFTADTVEGIIAALEAEQSGELAAGILKTIRSRSPTSVKVTHRQISAGQTMSMADCMRMEFRILNRMLAGEDFYEGIRCAIIDKGESPRWNPADLSSVTPAMVDCYFAEPPGGDLAL